MTKAARRHGAHVIRYSLRGWNASTSSTSDTSSILSSSAIGRHRTFPDDNPAQPVSLAAAACRPRPEMMSLLLLSIAAISTCRWRLFTVWLDRALLFSPHLQSPFTLYISRKILTYKNMYWYMFELCSMLILVVMSCLLWHCKFGINMGIWLISDPEDSLIVRHLDDLE